MEMKRAQGRVQHPQLGACPGTLSGPNMGQWLQYFRQWETVESITPLFCPLPPDLGGWSQVAWLSVT